MQIKPVCIMRGLDREDCDTVLTDSYAVRSVMLNTDNALAERARRVITEEIAEQGLCLQGWRTVPVNTGCLGPIALASLPVFEHFFVYNTPRSEEHTSELQSRGHLVCRLLLE